MADVGPVLFAGDSVTRYQYLTLIHFLASGKYQHPFNGSKSLSNAHAHVATSANERFEKLWEHSEEQVERHRKGSDLYYNTDRDEGLEHAHLTLPLHANASREAHLYYTYVDVHSSQIKEAIEWAMSKREDWRYLIFNMCAHYGRTSMNTLSGHIITAFQWANLTYGEAFARAGTQLVWKSCTTPFKSFQDKIDAEEEKIARYAAFARVRIYDLRTVVKAAFAQHLTTTWDDETVHYLQFMYEQWNDLLLNIVCPVGDADADADADAVGPEE
ncbi:hypothetical protein HXX76_002063 [Chlamydomonas incerta]|nr:hypothetical protein HXX76_002063 [Chlamydomonas incerta]|eukprot:KAG2443716.1 hypothetical protein HXX76_002063 [Chlamydomonas incerta]